MGNICIRTVPAVNIKDDKDKNTGALVLIMAIDSAACWGNDTSKSDCEGQGVVVL